MTVLSLRFSTDFRCVRVQPRLFESIIKAIFRGPTDSGLLRRRERKDGLHLALSPEVQELRAWHLSDLAVRHAKVMGKEYTLADFDGLSLFVVA